MLSAVPAGTNVGPPQTLLARVADGLLLPPNSCEEVTD